MSTAIDPSTLAALGLSSYQAQNTVNATTGKSASSLNQNDFMSLMIAQLKNQDPTQPMDSSKFMSQLAQFTTVSSIQSMQQSIQNMSTSLTSNQALQASTLVGHQVMAPTGQGVLTQGGSINGSITLPSAVGQVDVSITDANGQLLRTLHLGAHAAGPLQFSWDGVKDDGSYAAPGTYMVTATALVGGKNQAMDVQTVNKVDSVNLDPSGLKLNLSDGSTVDFSKVTQIM